MSDTPRTDAIEIATYDNKPVNLWGHARQLERELIAACEERDRFRKDSEALDYIIEQCKAYLIWNISDKPDCPEHLRKRLEGK